MHGDHWVLDEHGQPVAADLMTWARWMESAGESRRVAFTEVADGIEVSTVFLGLDHSFGGPVPLLFESMTFGGPFEGETARYATRAEAEAGHAVMVARAKAGAR